jgi:hypothetical protein
VRCPVVLISLLNSNESNLLQLRGGGHGGPPAHLTMLQTVLYPVPDGLVTRKPATGVGKTPTADPRERSFQ